MAPTQPTPTEAELKQRLADEEKKQADIKNNLDKKKPAENKADTDKKPTPTAKERYEFGKRAATPEQLVIIKAIEVRLAEAEQCPVEDFNEAQYQKLIDKLRAESRAAKERKAA